MTIGKTFHQIGSEMIGVGMSNVLITFIEE